MVRAIIQGYLNVNNRVACEDTRLHSALDTLINRLDIFLRDSTANDLVDELVALAGLVRLNDDLNMTVLALTTRLTSVLLINVSGAADGLLVSNLRRTYVSLYLELAQQTVNDDLQMKLAHTSDNGLAGLFIGVGLEGRVLFC